MKKNTFVKIIVIIIISILSIEWYNAIKYIYIEDKINHLVAFKEGISKFREPLWGIIAYQINLIYPEDPYIITVICIYIIIMFAMIKTGISNIEIIIVYFSPSLFYISAHAMRQGFAIALFMLLYILMCNRKKINYHSIPYFPLIVATIPSILIHNSILLVAIALIIIKNINRKYNGNVNILINVVNIVMLVTYAIYYQEISGFAILLSLIMLVLSINGHNKKDINVNIYSTLLIVVISGYLFTDVGLRVGIMLSLILPLVVPTMNIKYFLISTWAYPFITVLLSGGRLISMIPIL